MVSFGICFRRFIFNDFIAVVFSLFQKTLIAYEKKRAECGEHGNKVLWLFSMLRKYGALCYPYDLTARSAVNCLCGSAHLL